MPQAWRIVKEKLADSAFSGKGAADYGGRWNSRGVPVVYTSSTRALAALETLVHLNPPVTFQYVAIPIKFENTLIEHFPIKNLSPDWQLEPAPPSTRRIGDLWIAELRSAVLALPSVIIPGELNFLLNPAHSDFKKISLGTPEPFTFDPRLLA